MKKTWLVLSFCSAALWAQNPDPAKLMAEKQAADKMLSGGQVIGPIGIQAAMAGSAATITGAPYSADAITERVQVLADGNRIVQTTTNSVARDSEGRVRRDESLAIALPGSAGNAPKLEVIDDPVTGLHWTLDPQTKTASKVIFPMKSSALSRPLLPPPGPEKIWFYSSGAPGSQVTIQMLAKQKAEAGTNVSHVDLGTQTIEGVAAQGTRITRTLPTGAVGNEQPLVITTETWYSPALKVLVMSKAEDPRMGTTSYRLTNIQRAEPPASLFEIPADYTVNDKPGNVLFYKETRKE